jgi:NAD(P)-dependent dehydrogenase (short-subunit alcohol dehydrogenase family)
MTLKKVIVTGVSGYIGNAIAECFLNNGWYVYGTYLSNSKSISNLLNFENFVAHELDISDEESIISFAKSIEGNIYSLVNSAGINIPNDFDKISLEDWDKIFSVNVRGVFYLTQKLANNIVEGGSIINLASFSGQVGGPRTTHYAASKAAIVSLTQNMAIYFSRRMIRVNAVSPGVIESEMAKAAKNLPIMNDILLKRLGKAEEVADLVYFLSCDKSKYITAQTININGGLYF